MPFDSSLVGNFSVIKIILFLCSTVHIFDEPKSSRGCPMASAFSAPLVGVLAVRAFA